MTRLGGSSESFSGAELLGVPLEELPMRLSARALRDGDRRDGSG